MKQASSIIRTTAILIVALSLFTACNNGIASSNNNNWISYSSNTEPTERPANKEGDTILAEAIPLTELPYMPDAIAMDLSYYKYVNLSQKECGEYTFTLVANALNMQEDCYYARMKLIASKDGKALADEFIAAHSDGSQTGTVLYKSDNIQDIMSVETMMQNGKEYPLVIVKYKCHPSYGENAVTLSRFFTIIGGKGFTFHDEGFINYKNLSDNFTISGNTLYDNGKTLIFDFEIGKAEIRNNVE